MSLLAAGALAACRDGGAGPPHVLLITVDTLRADHLSAYGFRERQTPNIDRLADEGALFTFAHTDVTWTTPAMVSTLTGLSSARHGFRSHYDVLPEEATTVAELLRDAGYRTGAVVAAYPVASVFGLGQGFETYDEHFTKALIQYPDSPVKPVETRRGRTIQEKMDYALQKGLNDSWRPDDEVTQAALAMLEKLSGEAAPFFLWVHYFGPHDHLEAALGKEENQRRHLSTYADKIVGTDGEIGRLLDFLDREKISGRTLVILHADHGESLGERDFVGHGRYLYENTLRVPLIARWPGRISAGDRIGALVGNIDIAPTLLDAAGLGADGLTLDGKSLFRLLRGEKAIHDEMYCETFLPSHFGYSTPAGTGTGEFFDVGIGMRGVLRPPWKYMLREAHPFFDREGEEITPEIAYKLALGQLYDLAADPGEAESLMSERKLTALSLRESLDRFATLAEDQERARSVAGREEHLEKLRSLGYVQ